MQKSLCIILTSLALAGYGQHNEFTTYKNGLIYDEGTMNRLGVIVDSLNLQFKSCSASQPYYSLPQGSATFVTLEGHAAKARKAIENGITLREFQKKFPATTLTKVWLVKSRYKDDDQEMLRYSALEGYSAAPSITVKADTKTDKTSGWVIGPHEDFLAVYFDKLQSTALPERYARLVQYVDCMIDTSTQIFFPDAEGTDMLSTMKRNAKAEQFITWAENFPGKPELPTYEDIDELFKEEGMKRNDEYQVSYSIWDSLRLMNLDVQMKKFPEQMRLLKEACDDAMSSHASSDELEFYVERYISKNDALQLMRARKVMGVCSQDQSPRYHAMRNLSVGG